MWDTMNQVQLLKRIQYHAVSDVGLLRDNNEDALLCEPALGLFVVADGLGGHQAGEIASLEAVEFFKKHFMELIVKKGEPTDEAVFQKYVLESFYAANKEVYSLGKQHHLLKGMGTTFSVLAFFEKTTFVIHVGDSRIYRYRKNRFERVTHDHLGVRPTLVREKEAVNTKGFLTKALGTTETLLPQLSHFVWEGNDMFLLCSDGLSDRVSDEDLEKVLENSSLFLEEKVRTLIHLAKTYGGQDNITVILIQMQEDAL